MIPNEVLATMFIFAIALLFILIPSIIQQLKNEREYKQ
jgi:hypothetical protein